MGAMTANDDALGGSGLGSVAAFFSRRLFFDGSVLFPDLCPPRVRAAQGVLVKG